MKAWQKRRIKAGEDPSANWTREPEARVNGRILRPGTEFSVRGERGRFRFHELITTDQGVTWISCYGGPKGVINWRAFRPDRVRTVHTTRKTITAREAKDLLKTKRAQKKETQK